MHLEMCSNVSSDDVDDDAGDRVMFSSPQSVAPRPTLIS